MGCLCRGELPVMGSACEVPQPWGTEAPRASLGSRSLWRGSYKGGGGWTQPWDPRILDLSGP